MMVGVGGVSLIYAMLNIKCKRKICVNMSSNKNFYEEHVLLDTVLAACLYLGQSIYIQVTPSLQQ